MFRAALQSRTGRLTTCQHCEMSLPPLSLNIHTLRAWGTAQHSFEEPRTASATLWGVGSVWAIWWPGWWRSFGLAWPATGESRGVEHRTVGHPGSGGGDQGCRDSRVDATGDGPRSRSRTRAPRKSYQCMRGTVGIRGAAGSRRDPVQETGVIAIALSANAVGARGRQELDSGFPAARWHHHAVSAAPGDTAGRRRRLQPPGVAGPPRFVRNTGRATRRIQRGR
jgi:hypothetical protein